MDGSVLDLSCTVNPEDLKTTTKDILASVRKDWDTENVEFERCGIGFVNYVLCASVGGREDRIIFRVYGTQYAEILDKEQEKAATLLLNELGISPRVLCTFKNGICFEYVKGTIFSWKDFSGYEDLKVAKAFVRELARFHCMRTKNLASSKYKLNPHSGFCDKHFDNLISMYPTKEQFPTKDVQDLFEKDAPTKETVISEIADLRKMIHDMNLPLVFCHNDTNPSNSIYNREKDKCTLVDYDTAGFGYAEFDVAQFLKNTAFDLFTSPPPSSARYQPDYHRDVLMEYLQTRCQLDGEDETRAERLFDRCYAQVQKMYLVVSFIYFMYCVIDATLPELHHGTPIEYLRKAIETFDIHYTICKKELTL